MSDLFDSYQLGDLRLNNRIVMAPMTRSRAGDGDAPGPLNANYYAQRASAGLIVSEGTQPSADGKGYCRTPGIYTDKQVEGWRLVTDAVHTAGGKIVCQLMHCGRVGSALNKDADAETVAPSAIQAKGEIFTEQGMRPMDVPRALELSEIPTLIEQYATAANKAIDAGFDGVELHCTSGYLPMQFLSTGCNQRSDTYGGSAAKRIRFVVETLEAIQAAIGAARTGFRICPGNPFNDCHDEDPVETYTALLEAVTPLKLAYLHTIQSPKKGLDAWALAKQHFDGTLILNDNLDQASGTALIKNSQADLVSYGRHFIANPDLVRRFAEGAELANFDASTLYTPGPKGYTDYPSLD